MKRDIKDYLHLYLGCQTDKGKLIGIEMNKAICMMDDLEVVTGNVYNLKPILRPLSSMTEEDLIEIYKLDIDGQNAKFDSDVADNRYMRNCAMLQLKEYEAIRFMLSKGFDLFGLINSGLAVNAETLK